MTTDLSNIDSDRAEYTEYVQRFWVVLKTDGAVQANIETERSAQIVRRWAAKGSISELLTPLLSHEMESVRYAAAADLLNQAPSEEAIGVLREIASNPSGFIAPTAKLFLMKQRIPIRSQ